MKKTIKILSVILILVFAISLVSFDDNEELKGKTEIMVNALVNNDFNKAFNLVSGITTKEAFQSTFTELANYVDGVKNYELKQIGFKSQTQNGITATLATYLMTTNAKTYIVEAQQRSDVEGLYGFHVLESQINSDGIQCGTLLTMKGANALQWVFLIFSFIELAFVIIVLIDVIKQKLDKKAIWILIILLGTLSLTLNVSNSGINFNFGAVISLINSTALIRYATGQMAIRIMVPIGAIIYLIKRKSLINSYKANSQNTPLENVHYEEKDESSNDLEE